MTHVESLRHVLKPAQGDLRGYIVSSPWPEEGAVLVFAPTAREARNLGAGYIVDGYGLCAFTEVRAVWARGADPEAWGVTGPCVIEPRGCERCAMWKAAGPVDPDTKLCGECREESRDAA